MFFHVLFVWCLFFLINIEQKESASLAGVSNYLYFQRLFSMQSSELSCIRCWFSIICLWIDSYVNLNCDKTLLFLIFPQDPSNTQQHFAVLGFSPQYIFSLKYNASKRKKMKQQQSELNHNDSLEKTHTNIPCIINTLRTIQQILSSI